MEVRVQTKLTDWANEPSIKVLKEDLQKAKPHHNIWVSNVNQWRDLLNVEGSAKVRKYKNRSSVQPKLIRKQAEWRYSGLSEPFLSSYKIFQVLPRSFEDTQSARQNELLINYQFDTKINKVKFIDDLVHTVVDEGTAVVRVGWDRQSQIVEEVVPTYTHYPISDQAYLQQFQQLLNLKQSNPKEYENTTPENIKASIDYYMESGQVTQAVPNGQTIVQKEKLIENKPVLEILFPENVYIDPSCNGDFSKALFVVVSFETNRAELVSSGRYTNLDQIDWDMDITAGGEHYSNNTNDFNFSDASRKKVIAYEYWGYYDIYNNNTLVPFVATWVNDVIIRMELNPFPDQKLPFVIIPYLPVKRSIYGEPDAVLLEENQRIQGAILRGIIDLLANSANSQTGFAKGLLDAVNLQKFNSGQNYEFNPNLPIQQGYIQHTYPEIPTTSINLMQMLSMDAESLTGVKSFSGGITGNAYGDVAEGIRGALDAASKREMAILRRLAKGVSEIGSKIVAMNQAFVSEEEVVRLTNENFVAINREELAGSYDLQVDINTAEVDNAKAQDLGFMLQTIGPNLEPKITTDILADIADLKRMPKLAKQLRDYVPKPDEMEQRLKMAQISVYESQAQLNMAEAQAKGGEGQVRMAEAQIKAQQAQANAQRLNIEAQKLQIDGAKVQSEISLNQAKTENINAGTVAIGVETQQMASGMTHAYDLEKQQAQARANQNLEVTKALLKARKYDEVAPNVDAAIGFNALSKRL